MGTIVKVADKRMASVHRLGVTCGLVAGVWLGAAEAPTKLVTTGLSRLPSHCAWWQVSSQLDGHFLHC